MIMVLLWGGGYCAIGGLYRRGGRAVAGRNPASRGLLCSLYQTQREVIALGILDRNDKFVSLDHVISGLWYNVFGRSCMD